MCLDTNAKKTIKTLYLFLLLSLITGTAAVAKEAKVSDLVVTSTQDELLVFTTVKHAFNKKMKNAVKNGLSATFFFHITLSDSRKMWVDKTIAERKETHTITYDPVKEKYSVTRSWEKNTQPFITSSLEEACDRMRRIEGLPLIRTDKLEKGATYFVKAKAELYKISLPLYLHYVLFFVSLWDIETDWQEISFTH